MTVFGRTVRAGWTTAIAIFDALPSQSTASPAQASPFGTWVNMSGTVKVRTGDCDGKLCGWIIWAAADAEHDARDSGIEKLIGTELLQDYLLSRSGAWAGQVFVPDIGRKFYSTIVAINDDSLEISGCIFGGLICKSQIWRRV